MIEKYGICCRQNLYQERNGEIHNEYHFQTGSGIYLGWIRLPGDGQFTVDAQFINAMMKALAVRYGFIKSKQNSK